MAGLIKQATHRDASRSLRKAADAHRDPADLHSVIASDNDGTNDSNSASDNDSANAVHIDSESAGQNTSNAASNPADDAGDTGAGGAARNVAVKAATTTASSSAGGRARGTAGRGASARRVGRPAGPARVPLSTRILVDLDVALTSAVEHTGLSPQPIIEAALRAWLTQHHYLAGNVDVEARATP